MLFCRRRHGRIAITEVCRLKVKASAGLRADPQQNRYNNIDMCCIRPYWHNRAECTGRGTEKSREWCVNMSASGRRRYGTGERINFMSAMRLFHGGSRHQRAKKKRKLKTHQYFIEISPLRPAEGLRRHRQKRLFQSAKKSIRLYAETVAAMRGSGGARNRQRLRKAEDGEG